ncbi:cell wall-binding repeat-containing protein, partial [Clostridioides sp. GD02377]|uniref:cell wall-binding repeat-containing protein n=1 Tax=unclassified Clostridioides TaxID=2635829 RepID=UPI0038B0A181
MVFKKSIHRKRKDSSLFVSLLISSALFSFSYNSVYADGADNNLKTDSIQAQNNFNTAISVSKHGWNSSKNIVLIKDKALADSLAVIPLAKALDAPILITDKDSIPESTLNEISRLGAKNITLIGGLNSISDSVVNTLKNKGLTVDRIGGTDRQD